MRATPEAAFAEASAAMGRGDWHAFFACIDRDSLRTIARNGIGRFVAGGDASAPVLRALCASNGAAAELVDTLQSLAGRIVESARATMARGIPTDPQVMLQDSLRHKAVIDEYRATLEAIVGGAAALAALTADLEIALRDASGSGSVSNRLFVDESLESLTATGSRARGIRRMASGATEEVTFVRRGGDWFIRPFSRR